MTYTAATNISRTLPPALADLRFSSDDSVVIATSVAMRRRDGEGSTTEVALPVISLHAVEAVFTVLWTPTASQKSVLVNGGAGRDGGGGSNNSSSGNDGSNGNNDDYSRHITATATTTTTSAVDIVCALTYS